MKAKDVKHIAHRRLMALGTSLGNKSSAVRLVVDNGGPSDSWVRKFQNGELTNPTVDSLDQLAAALDKIEHHQVTGL